MKVTNLKANSKVVFTQPVYFQAEDGTGELKNIQTVGIVKDINESRVLLKDGTKFPVVKRK